MTNILLYISNILVIISFITYFLFILSNKKKNITNSNGFNVTKDILNEYESINIIENKGYFTFYNLKRKVIKISSNCYYGSSISDIIVPLVEAAISAVDDNKNNYVQFLNKLVPNLKCLYILPIIAILLNTITLNVSDAKTSLLFLLLFSFIEYILIDIKNDAFIWLDNNIKKIKDISKSNKNQVLKRINTLLFLDKIIFIGELVMIIRFVAIILEIH